MANVVFVGAYAYAREVLQALPESPVAIVTDPRTGQPRHQAIWNDVTPMYWNVEDIGFVPDLVVVAGWRRLVPIVAPTVGFHSAKLPEYPGRAPVANAILRGDRYITNTMLWLDDGVDTGDIIDEAIFSNSGDPDDIYRLIGETSAEMLRRHWDGLIDGSAPRRPQDMSKRGPLTSADAWRKLAARRQPAWIEAFG